MLHIIIVTLLELRKENAVFTEFLDLLHRLFELTQREVCDSFPIL